MSKEGINVQLSVKEIYDAMCPKCKQKIKQLVKDKISDQMVNQVIGGG